MAWQYGYFDTNGRWNVIEYGTWDRSAFDNDDYRKVFYNPETGQSLPYGAFKDGDPGATRRQAAIGVDGIVHYLNTGKLPSVTDKGKTGTATRQKKFIENFIKSNGGWDIWENYDGTALPTGIPGSQFIAGRPRDGEGNILSGYDEQGNPVYKPSREYMSEATKTTTGDAYEDALNAYYKDLYSLQAGTGGADMYNKLAEVYTNQATVQESLANATYQQQAMQQAQVVKQISDQVRAERMARLRAGMSTAQIANQDMINMMTNVEALNQQAAEANAARLEARGAALTAQDQAYLSYLEQSNARGQVAMAGYATDAGNVAYQVQQYLLNNPGVSYTQAYRTVTGQDKGD